MTSLKQHLNDWLFFISHSYKSYENLALESVQEYPENIKDIDNPSERIQIAAIEKDASLIKHIQNPTERASLLAVEKDTSTIQYIKDPSEKVQMTAIDKDASAIRYISNPSESVKLKTVEIRPDMIRYINNPSEKIQLTAVRANPLVIQHIKSASDEVQQVALNLNSEVLKYIEKYQIEAVQKNPQHIQSIPNPSEKVQLTAVKANPLAIQFINCPSEKAKYEAVSLNPSVIQHIKDPSEDIQWAAIKRSPSSIRFIESPFSSVSKAALESLYNEPLNIEPEKIENFSGKIKELFSELGECNSFMEETGNLPYHEEPPYLYNQNEKEEILSSFKKEIEFEQATAEFGKQKIQDISHHYQNLGYNTLSNIIADMKPGEKKEVAVCSTKGKELYADIHMSKDYSVKISNYRITDKTTGQTCPLELNNDIDITNQSLQSVENILQGKEASMISKSGVSQNIGLNRTSLGWGLQIGKQVFSAADTSAEI